MQITLNHNEIIDAIDSFVRKQINIRSDQEIDIDLKAGRGDNGFSATLDIRDAKKRPAARSMPTAEEAPAPLAPKKDKPVIIEEKDEEKTEETPEPVAETKKDEPAEDKEKPKATSIFSKVS